MTFVIICLDGFKQEYLEKTRFLNTLSKNNLNGEVNHGFGYASDYNQEREVCQFKDKFIHRNFIQFQIKHSRPSRSIFNS